MTKQDEIAQKAAAWVNKVLPGFSFYYTDDEQHVLLKYFQEAYAAGYKAAVNDYQHIPVVMEGITDE